MAGFLTRERIVAPPGWSRWLIPPAALSIHLAIGQAYAWSAFKTPLEKGLGISGVASALPFTLGIIMLGLSAALFGTKVDTNGPRWAMAVATAFFSGGFLVSGAGLYLNQYWLVVLGYGFLGGIGLGIGYISPVSTLIKWFPDRPGLATGLAIMGFGGGALIASPLTAELLGIFGATGNAPSVPGIGATFVTMGVIYAVFMSLGWLLIRVPAEGWSPPGLGSRDVEAGKHDHPRSGVGGERHQDTAVLAAVGGALLQRDRRDRHPGEGESDLPGLLPRLHPRAVDQPRPPSGSCRSCRSPTRRAGSRGRRCRTSWGARTCTGSIWASARCCTCC